MYIMKQSISIKSVRDRTQHIELKWENIIVSERIINNKTKKKEKVIWYTFPVKERPKKWIWNIESDYVRFVEWIMVDMCPTYRDEYHPIYARIRDAQIQWIKTLTARFLEK